MDYARLVAVLIEAVKAQQREIEGQQAAIQALMARIEALERSAQGADVVAK